MADPTPVPVPPHAPQWTPNNVFGILCQIGAVVVFWLIPEDSGKGMGTALLALAAVLLGTAPAVPLGGNRGNARVGFLVLAAAVGALALGLGGCGALQVKAEKTVDVDIVPGPPCRVTVSADGQVVSTVSAPQKCAVTTGP